VFLLDTEDERDKHMLAAYWILDVTNQRRPHDLVRFSQI